MNGQPKSEQAIFAAVIALPPGEREAYLHEACAGNAALRKGIDELLKSHDEGATFLEKPPQDLTLTQTAIRAVLITEKVGDRIGRYKLLQQIGEGGCGVVYMAEQEEPVRRRVALKLIKLGMDTKHVIARFEAERQALALMDHPNIARVFDAGATENGRPYFVMELVRGDKITEFCDEQKLSAEERLKLFIQVCQAVQHAHQKGIIHRDIKPSNVLVTINDGVPVPKVIDFGIAKATQGRLTDQTVFTAFEQFLGTPAYMSPEQADMTSLDIDTRTDIYSLGVLLYELLSGKTPFDTRELLASGLDEMRRTIREKEPPKPSTRLSTMQKEELTTTAQRRRTEPPKLIHSVRGDLDWIVMKSLEKDRARRYEAANGLAADIQRHLGNEPVLARPPTKRYRLQKLVRRNKLAFAAIVAVTAALSIGIGVSTWLFLKERAAEHAEMLLREKAQVEAAKSQQVAHFLETMLSSIDPSVALGRDVSVLKEVVDDTATRVGQDLTNQPAVEAELSHTLGKVYWSLGDLSQARAMDSQALAIQRTFVGDDADVADTSSDLAMVLWRQGKLAQAESMLEDTLAIQRKIPGDNLAVAKTLKNLGGVLGTRGKVTQSIASLREALAIEKEQPGMDQTEVADTLSNLASVLAREGMLAEAESNVCKALFIQTNRFGGEHPEVADSLNVLAGIKEKQNDKDDAETLYRKVLAMRQKLFGNEHPQVALSYYNLGRFLAAQNRPLEAEPPLRSALAIQEKLLGPNAETILTAGALGILLRKELRYSEAEVILRYNLKVAIELYGKDGVRAAGADYNLANVLEMEHKLPEAESLLEDSVRIRQHLNPAHPDSGDSLITLRVIYMQQGRSADAHRVTLEGIKQGYAEAMNYLGMDYLHGRGVPKDEAEAIKWFKKAASPEDEWPNVNLGELYEKGMGVPKDLAQAGQYYQEAADHDCVGGLTHLAYLYEVGLGVPKNADKAKKLLQRAIDLGDSRGWAGMAWMLATSSNPSARDGTNAIVLAERLVDSDQGKNAYYLDILAASYAEAGQFDMAEQSERKAIVLADAGTDTNLISDLSDRLELFQKKLPYHQTPPTDP